MEKDSTKIFAKNWRIYQEILEHNYMFHRDFSEQIKKILEESFSSSPIDVLDSGCGDAYMLSKLLNVYSIQSFTGYDMSAQALKVAARNLESLNTDVQLIEGPMELSIRQETKSFHLIYSSFAIHHLSDAEKQNLLANFYHKLAKDGILIIIDILRNPTLSREEYLEEYITHISTQWNKISDDDKELIFDHMRNFDFPATNSEFTHWVEEAGFKIQSRFDADSRNMMLVAQK